MENRYPNQELLGERRDQAAAYASDIGLLGILRALMRLRGLVLLPFLARTLGPAAFGVWTQSLVAIDIGSSIVSLQLHQAVIRFVAGVEGRKRQRQILFPVLSIAIALGILITSITLVVPEPIASLLLGDLAYVEIARWLGLWIAVTTISRIGLEFLRGVHRVRLYGFLTTGQMLVQLITVLSVLLLFNQLLLAVIAAIAIDVLGAVLVLMLCFREVGFGFFGWGRTRSILLFSLPLVPGYSADLLLSFSDRLFIAATLGAEAIGVYAAAYSLARLVREIYVPFNTAMLPAVSRAWDQVDLDQARWVITNTLRYYMFLAIPMWVGISLVGANLLDLLATSAVSRPTVQLIPFLGLGLLLSSLQQAYATVLQLAERTKALAVGKILVACAYVVLVAVAVPRWGLLGGAVVTAIGYALDLSFSAVLSAQHGRIFPALEMLFRQVISAGLMIPAVLLIRTPGFLGVTLKVAIGFTVYIFAMIIVGGIGEREYRFMKSIVARRNS